MRIKPILVIGLFRLGERAVQYDGTVDAPSMMLLSEDICRPSVNPIIIVGFKENGVFGYQCYAYMPGEIFRDKYPITDLPLNARWYEKWIPCHAPHSDNIGNIYKTCHAKVHKPISVFITEKKLNKTISDWVNK